MPRSDDALPEDPFDPYDDLTSEHARKRRRVRLIGWLVIVAMIATIAGGFLLRAIDSIR